MYPTLNFRGYEILLLSIIYSMRFRWVKIILPLWILMRIPFFVPTSIQVIGAHGGHLLMKTMNLQSVTMVAGHTFSYSTNPLIQIFCCRSKKWRRLKQTFRGNCLFAIAASGSPPWRSLLTPAMIKN